MQIYVFFLNLQLLITKNSIKNILSDSFPRIKAYFCAIKVKNKQILESDNSSAIKKIVLPIALIFGAGRIIFDLIPKIAGANSKVYYATFLVAFVFEVLAIIYTIKKYKKSQNNSINLKEALIVGVMFMVIVGGLYAIQSYLYDVYIDPEFQRETALEWANLYGKSGDVEKMMNEGDRIQETSSIFSIISSILKFSLLGILASFIVGTIVRNR